MNAFFIVAIVLNWAVVGVGCWLGWQLLRQNGRILLRLDELEKRLDELEFGESEEERGSPGPLHLHPADSRRTLTEASRSDSVPAADEDTRAPAEASDSRAARFNNRSLGRSKIKRDGLKAGTFAPSFRLPRLDGGELSLEELRGKRVLLVFSDPHCGPCKALAPQLEKFHRKHSATTRLHFLQSSPALGDVPDSHEHPLTLSLSPTGGEGGRRPGEAERGNVTEVAVVMISRGEPKENRAKVKEHGLTLPVVLQQRWEISRLYAMFATPVAYLIDEAGVITHDVAVGVEPILTLMHKANESFRGPVEPLR